MRAVVVMVLIAAALLSTSAWAEEGWPSTMEIGGFTISGITGEKNADGSGKASGRITLPGDCVLTVDLVCSSLGAVSASSRSGFSVSGVRVDGSFLLDNSSRGMKGTGAVITSGKPITDANITVEPSGELDGEGRVDLGSGFSAPVTFSVGGQGVSVQGNAEREASADTPLAVYVFKGDIEVSAFGTAIVTTAKGQVERKGKIGGVTSTFGPLTCEVEPATGIANIDVGGAMIAFDLW